MNFPNCERLLYSRRHKNCGYCGALLPEEVLFSPSEIAKLDAEMADLEARRAKFKAKEEEDRQRAQENAATSSAAFIFIPP